MYILYPNYKGCAKQLSTVSNATILLMIVYRKVLHLSKIETETCNTIILNTERALRAKKVSKQHYISVQKVTVLHDLQKVFSHVEHLSIEQCFMLKHNASIQNDENKWENCFQCC